MPVANHNEPEGGDPPCWAHLVEDEAGPGADPAHVGNLASAEVNFDVIDEASAQSFPASDPPAWATGQGHSAVTTPQAPPPDPG